MFLIPRVLLKNKRKHCAVSELPLEGCMMLSRCRVERVTCLPVPEGSRIYLSGQEAGSRGWEPSLKMALEQEWPLGFLSPLLTMRTAHSKHHLPFEVTHLHVWPQVPGEYRRNGDIVSSYNSDQFQCLCLRTKGNTKFSMWGRVFLKCYYFNIIHFQLRAKE